MLIFSSFEKSRFILQNIPKNLDPPYTMNLDVGDYFGRENPILQLNYTVLIYIFGKRISNLTAKLHRTDLYVWGEESLSYS